MIDANFILGMIAGLAIAGALLMARKFLLFLESGLRDRKDLFADKILKARERTADERV